MRFAHTVRTILTSTTVVAALLMLQTAAAVSQGLSKDLAPQPLAQALEAFAAETGLQLVYRAEIASGLSTRGARAGLSSEETLRELLRETGLTFEFVNRRTITIRAAYGDSRPVGAEESRALGAAQGSGGESGAVLVAQTEANSSAGAQPAAREEQSAPAPNKSLLTDIGEVLVTGSRIKRVEVEGPAPLTIIARDQIDREGFTTVYEALYSLTQQTGSGLQTQFSPNGATANATNIDLRGLGPGRVLILFNGRRAADYPLPFNGQSNIVNLSAIPTAAVDRIEVLASGASAIYGSDAVSGVVNVVMRDQFDGIEVSARLGGTTEGGGETRRVQLTGGLDSGGFKGVYALEYFDRNPIWAFDRSAFDSNADHPPGFPAADDFVAGIGAPFSGAPIFLDATSAVCSNFGREVRVTPLGPFGDICSSQDLQAQRTIRHDTEDKSGFFNSTYDFGNGLELFGTLSVWQSDSMFHTQPGLFWQTPGLILDVTPGVGNDLGSGGQYIVPLRFFQINENPDPDLIFDERAWDTVLGLRGKVFGDRLDWELAYHHSDYTVERDQRTLVTQALDDFYFGPQLGVDPTLGAPVYQVRRDRVLRALTPDEYRSITALNHTDADSSNDQASVVVSGDLFDVPAGALQFAGVLEWGTQDYRIQLDPRLTAGEFFGITEFPGRGERDRYAAGVELAVPVLETVRLTLAGRYDKYDDITDVDDAVTYNAGLEYRPFKSLLLRGSYATSFRAPDMHFVFAAPSTLFAAPLDELRCRRDAMVTDLNLCPFVPLVVDLHRRGNPGLEEETGESFTAGFAWNILQSLDLTVDYFDIQIDELVDDLSFGFILQTEADCVLGETIGGQPVDSNSALCAFATAQVIRDPVTGALRTVNTGPINRALQSVRGLDADLNYRLDTARVGDFHFNLAWSHVLEEERQEFATDPVDSYRDDPNNLDLRSRMRGSVTWEMGTWAHTLFGDRRGSRPTFDELGRTKSYTTYNYSANYRPTENLKFSLVVDNLLDEDPKIDDTFSNYPFFYQSNINPVGREVFIQAAYRF